MRWDITISKVVLDGEADQFIAAIPGGSDILCRRTKLILWMLINTGIRVSELCSLRVKDMPQMLGSLFIEIYRGKGKKSRNVPVSEKFAAEIADYVEQIRPGTMPRRLARNSRDGWLFYARGKKMTRQQVHYLVRKVARMAGLKKPISPHMWRHRFATRAIAKDGGNLYRVKGWLGHASLMATEKYLHLAGMLDCGGGEMLDQRRQVFATV